MRSLRKKLNWIFLIIGAVGIYFTASRQTVEHKTEKLNLNIAQLIEKADQAVPPLLINYLSKGFSSPSESLELYPVLQELSQKDFGLYFFKNDSLIFWTKNNFFPSSVPSQQKVLAGDTPYLLITKVLDCCTLVVAIPIPLENRFEWSFETGNIPVLGKDQFALGSLKRTTEDNSIPFNIWWILVLISFGGLVNSIANWISKKYQPVSGILFLGLIISIFRLYVLPILSWWEDQKILTYLLDCSIFFWLVVFFYRNFEKIQLKKWAVLIYLFIIGVFLSVSFVIKENILTSTNNFTLGKLFQFSPDLTGVVTGLFLLLLGLYLLTHRLFIIISEVGLSRNKRLLWMVGCIALSAPFFRFFNLDIATPQMILLLLIYLILFDLFVETRGRSLSWLVIWVVFFSAFPTFFFVKYHIEKSLIGAEKIAQLLTQKNWAEVEEAMSEFGSGGSITEFPLVYNNFNHEKIADFNYRTIPTSYSGLVKLLNYPIPLSYGYLGTNDTLIFTPKWEISGRIYEEKLKEGEVNLWAYLENYSFALATENRNVYQKGEIPSTLLLDAAELKPGETQRIINSERADLIYKTDEGSLVAVGQELRGYQQGLAIFSYFFILLAVILVILALLNTWLEAIQAPVMGNPSLSNRLQLVFGGLILVSFLGIGIYTVSFFKNSFTEDEERRLDSLIETFKKEKENFSEVSALYNTDLNFYGLDGRIEWTTNHLALEKGLVPERISTPPLFYIQNLNDQPFIERLKIGTTAYLAIKNRGILAIPFQPYYEELDKTIFEFIASLLTFYVIFLLVAVFLVIVLTRRISQPIVQIAQRLKNISLSDKNERLEWKLKDEVGILVDRYNVMIEELEEKAEKLKQSEREGAWRQMAKQVAHEIKNPLTPMKLSVQHLMRAHKAQPEDTTENLKKVSSTLIEQIEGLTKIANEFSNFANMPLGENAVFELNECLRSIYHLHSSTGEDWMEINLKMEDGAILVFADKDQIMRVFQNLVTNAIQSIPKGEKGKIEIVLSIKDGEAVVEVKDNGSGIPPGIREMVFFPNFTTKSSGTGLGLAICKNIVVSAGGNIDFETEEGKGTIFTVRLPIYQD